MMIKQKLPCLFSRRWSQDVPCAGLNASGAARREALPEVLRQTCGWKIWLPNSIPHENTQTSKAAWKQK